MKLKKPSPALVISCIALFVSLGGVGYAAATGSIDSREIRNNSVRGKDVRNSSLGGRDIANASLSGADIRNGRLVGHDLAGESVTGLQVSERSLGKVPSAAAADTAGTAFSAATLNGVRVAPFSYRSDATTATSPRAGAAGLEVVAGCNGGDLSLELVNRSGSDAMLTTEGANEVLSPNEPFDVGAGADNATSGQAGFVVNSTGRAVRVQWSLAENVLGFDCYASGLVIG